VYTNKDNKYDVYASTLKDQMFGTAYLFLLTISITSGEKHDQRKRSLTIDLDTIRNTKYSMYSRLMDYTIPEYRGYAAAEAGREHYAIVSFFSALFSKSPAYFVDIGTRFATSALTLGAQGHGVISYDIPGSFDLKHLLSELKIDLETWNNGVKLKGGNITLKQMNILDHVSSELPLIVRSPLVLLDTYHRPYTQPFERELIHQLENSKFSGILLLDDIYQHDEMKKWFLELICQPSRRFQVYDLTVVGHATGTGLLNFGHFITSFVGIGSENIQKFNTDPRCTHRF
jgi:hypothetical protein